MKIIYWVTSLTIAYCYKEMSLITDRVLMGLWEIAQAQPSDEWAAVSLWTQLWNKHLFPETDWVISQQPPSEGNDRRRVHLTIKYLGGDSGNLTILAFHEKISDARPRDIEELENQASDTCRRYLEKHRDVQFVYAVTSFGTKGRAWCFDRDGDCLVPLFGSNRFAQCGEYIDLHSSEAGELKKAVETMRSVAVLGG